MVGILTLPVELVREVCRQIRDGDEQVDHKRDWKKEQKALAHLCRTSKAFDQIARPVLYNRIEVSLRQERFLSLIRTLASRNDLSQIVQHLKLKSSDFYRHELIQNPEDDGTINVTDIFGKWWPESVNNAKLHKELCNWKKPVDVLYILVPNIETMRIFTAPIPRYTAYEESPSMVLLDICRLRQAREEDRFVAPLGRLTSLDVSNNGRRHFSSTWYINSLFSLAPTGLVSLTIRHFDGSGGVGSLCANLRSLSLYDCSLGRTDMATLMATCRGLRKFAYTQAYEDDGFGFEDCMTALKERSSTLVELYLLFRVYDRWEDRTYDSFASFTSLKILSIHTEHMIRSGADLEPGNAEIINTFPKSLEVFNVITDIGVESALAPRLVRLGELATGGDLPNLKLVEIQCHPGPLNMVGDINVRRSYLDYVKQQLWGLVAGSCTLPLRISAYDGDGKDPSAQSRLRVKRV
ncbi:hypothetical protein LX36DRAFT_753411 [Colletotrichum falcatum]|nr:hypothetical protein LX36DRAFT_753411 [Colletotrichum falcatum]